MCLGTLRSKDSTSVSPELVFAERKTMDRQPRSFRLDASGLDELGPSVRVFADESRELAGSAGEALDAEIGEARSESRIGEG